MRRDKEDERGSLGSRSRGTIEAFRCLVILAEKGQRRSRKLEHHGTVGGGGPKEEAFQRSAELAQMKGYNILFILMPNRNSHLQSLRPMAKLGKSNRGGESHGELTRF